jgi:dTDP-4-amino-4,6-dideoxygalactose transaminase
MRKIPFSPPDITQAEIDEVVKVLKSGWITTGPETKLFESRIAEYCNVERAACLSSQTSCAELTLRILGIGPGDEVILPAYTACICRPRQAIRADGERLRRPQQ